MPTRLGTTLMHLVLANDDGPGLLEFLDRPRRLLLLLEEGDIRPMLHTELANVAFQFNIILDTDGNTV